MENQLIPFQGDRIRKAWHNEQWYFSVVDIVAILTESPNPARYWADVKRRAEKESGEKVFAFCEPLKMQTSGGKQNVICANTEGILRIVMSIPSPKAEPLRLWLAQVGNQFIEETENPELSFERMTEIYQAKGYSEEWITRRVESIKARKRLTDEWKNRGVTENKDFSILTATIAKGTFGLNPSEHKDLKGLTKPNQELRDHMTPIELILTALGEETTRMIAINDDAQGFHENHDAAVKGGKTAGEARKRVEAVTGQKVVSKENYLNIDKNSALQDGKDT
jgi:DNA-damage-inducible protein D